MFDRTRLPFVALDVVCVALGRSAGRGGAREAVPAALRSAPSPHGAALIACSPPPPRGARRHPGAGLRPACASAVPVCRLHRCLPPLHPPSSSRLPLPHRTGRAAAPRPPGPRNLVAAAPRSRGLGRERSWGGWSCCRLSTGIWISLFSLLSFLFSSLPSSAGCGKILCGEGECCSQGCACHPGGSERLTPAAAEVVCSSRGVQCEPGVVCGLGEADLVL